MTIRLTQPNDYRATESLMREAFWNVYSPGCYEHYLLHKLRQHADYIGSLDFVAVDDDRITGNIIFNVSSI